MSRRIYDGLPNGLEKKIARKIARLVIDQGLIEAGDRVLVAFSGGKDSYALCHFLAYLHRVAPISFDLGVFHLNASYPAAPYLQAIEGLRACGFDVWVEDIDMTAALAQTTAKGESPCPLCSRLRRGIIYTQATKRGYNKVALGHHREDTNETLLLNVLFAGQMKAMPAKLLADNNEQTVIRPMLHVSEELIVEATRYLALPIVQSTFCTRESEGMRYRVKKWLAEMAKENPKIHGNILHALGNVVPSHLLDKHLYKDES